MSDGRDLRDMIAALGLKQAELAREMIALGDDRNEKAIVRSFQRMMTGEVRVSGELRAFLGLMAKTRS